MQKTLLTKLSIIAGLCILFSIGLAMLDDVIYERQSYADSVIREIAQQHINPQQVITPFIAIPTTVTPECQLETPTTKSKCAPPYSVVETVLASQTQTKQNLKVDTDTYKRGIYHATSYNGHITFNQNYAVTQALADLNKTHNTLSSQSDSADSSTLSDHMQPEKTTVHWHKAKLIIPVSDLRGVTTLPTVTMNQKSFTASYPQTPMFKELNYIEVDLPQEMLVASRKNISHQQDSNNLSAAHTTDNETSQSQSQLQSQPDNQPNNSNQEKPLSIVIDVPLSGISYLSTVPTGHNFRMTMDSDWQTPNFIGKALPNTKNFSATGFKASWQNQYLTVANNQYLSQCARTPNNKCVIDNTPALNIDNQPYHSDAFMSTGASRSENMTANDSDISETSVRLSSFGVSFANPNDVYLQTERTMKYALLLMLVSFGTFFLFEVLKSSRIHPIQYLLVGCALFIFYLLLLPLAEQIAFWQAYTVAASACAGLIGWYAYYIFGDTKRAAMFTAILAGLYASFFGILSTEDLNLLLGAIFCFVILACVMVMTRKLDWYNIT